MKLVTLAYLTTLFLPSIEAWVLSKKKLQQAAEAAFVSASIAAAPLVANAVDFSGSYSDPSHPNCKRVIEVTKKRVNGKNVAKLSGTDGSPGCPAGGSGTEWELTGKVADSKSIFVDFSPKGGPENLLGIWDSKSPAGIKWPDGNKWTKQ